MKSQSERMQAVVHFLSEEIPTRQHAAVRAEDADAASFHNAVAAVLVDYRNSWLPGIENSVHPLTLEERRGAYGRCLRRFAAAYGFGDASEEDDMTVAEHP